MAAVAAAMMALVVAEVEPAARNRAPVRAMKKAVSLRVARNCA